MSHYSNYWDHPYSKRRNGHTRNLPENQGLQSPQIPHHIYADSGDMYAVPWKIKNQPRKPNIENVLHTSYSEPQFLSRNGNYAFPTAKLDHYPFSHMYKRPVNDECQFDKININKNIQRELTPFYKQPQFKNEKEYLDNQNFCKEDNFHSQKITKEKYSCHQKIVS